MYRKSRVPDIIRRAYGQRYGLDQKEATFWPAGVPFELRYGPRWQNFLQFLQQKAFLFSLCLFVAILSLSAVYYYNLLVDTQQNMQEIYANVHALIQRRNDIANNLSKAVLDYSQHEQQVFTAITSLRATTAEKSAPGSQFLAAPPRLPEPADIPSPNGASPPVDLGATASLTRLMAIAEQYPDLKLSTNFERLMTALIEVEKDLSLERMKHNKVTNIYTTNVAKFPCLIFARIFGFEIVPYFAASEEAVQFKTITY